MTVDSREEMDIPASNEIKCASSFMEQMGTLIRSNLSSLGVWSDKPFDSNHWKTMESIRHKQKK